MRQRVDRDKRTEKEMELVDWAIDIGGGSRETTMEMLEQARLRGKERFDEAVEILANRFCLQEKAVRKWYHYNTKKGAM